MPPTQAEREAEGAEGASEDMPGTPAPIEIIVHDLDQARAVLKLAGELGLKVQLRSAPYASAYAGVGYLHALGNHLEHELLIDCHDDAGLVMAALRAGCGKIIFAGADDMVSKLTDMADQRSAQIRPEPCRPEGLLTLSPGESADAIRERLSNLRI